MRVELLKFYKQRLELMITDLEDERNNNIKDLSNSTCDLEEGCTISKDFAFDIFLGHLKHAEEKLELYLENCV